MIRLFLATLALCSLLGCGYTVGSRAGADWQGATLKVLLGPVQNQVLPPRPGIEFDFTQRLKDEMFRDRRFQQAGQSHDVKVDVALLEFREPNIVRDLDNVQTEIGFRVDALVRVEDRAGTREERISAFASYAPGLSEPRGAGLDRLWRELALEVLDVVDQRNWLAAATAREIEASEER